MSDDVRLLRLLNSYLERDLEVAHARVENLRHTLRTVADCLEEEPHGFSQGVVHMIRDILAQGNK